MSVMHFIPELARYLGQNKYIYTVRAYYYNTSEAMIPGLGLCRRVLMAQLDEQSLSVLEDYVTKSGFATLDDWISKIQQFIPSGKTMYLYKVELLGK